jgi:hypothetical protein
MNTFILTIPSLDCHILPSLNNSIMSIEDLEILEISVLI